MAMDSEVMLVEVEGRAVAVAVEAAEVVVLVKVRP